MRRLVGHVAFAMVVALGLALTGWAVAAFLHVVDGW